MIDRRVEDAGREVGNLVETGEISHRPNSQPRRKLYKARQSEGQDGKTPGANLVAKNGSIVKTRTRLSWNKGTLQLN